MNPALPFTRISSGFLICFVFVQFFNLGWASNNSDFDQLKQAAESGNIEAQYLIGAAYFYGDNIKKVKSIDYKGKPVQQDMIKAARWLKKPAEQGYKYAPWLMGGIYHTQFKWGNVFNRKAKLDQDGEEAVRWYRIGANKGHKPSRDQMTHLMRDWGIKLKAAPAPVTNINHLMKDAVKGNADAQYNLGLMYAKGEGMNQDFQKAGKWFYLAATNGHEKAQDNIGDLYYKGHGVKQDYRKAIEWYLKALAQDNSESAFMLGIIYNKGEGVPKDIVKGFHYIQRAAELGHPKGQNHMGYCYATGKCPSISLDIDKAIEWYTKAVNQGDKEAMMNLNTAEYQKSLAENKGFHTRRGNGSVFFLSEPEMKNFFVGATKVLGEVLWLQSAIDEIADSQTQSFDKADPECKDNLLKTKRIVECTVETNLNGGYKVNCDGHYGAFNETNLKCQGAISGDFGYERIGTFWCDPQTQEYDRDIENVINKICR